MNCERVCVIYDSVYMRGEFVCVLMCESGEGRCLLFEYEVCVNFCGGVGVCILFVYTG